MGRALSDKEQAFAREYIRNGNNAYQAAIAVGYSKSTALGAADWLNDGESAKKRNKFKPELRELIDSMIAEAEMAKICTPEEALRFFSAVARGQIDDYTVTSGGDVIQVPASLSERHKHMKTLLDYRDRIVINTAPGADGKRYDIMELVAPDFLGTYRRVLTGACNELIEKGGRGSTKSSFMGIMLLQLLERHRDCHAVCVRKWANTLRTSVYSQLQWAAAQMYDPGEWKFTISPMAMTRVSTGQRILFYGLDDPAKLKSIKLSTGYIGVLWFEELDQFDGPEEIRSVEQSCLRGGEFSMTLKSFNPPASARNWANLYALEEKEGKLVQHSDYRAVPPEWLGSRFLDDACHLAEINPAAYRHEYLGEVTGCGKEVFTNVRTERIDPGQMDRRIHGIDWGWYPDPWAYNGCMYDPARRTLYIYDELTRRRTPNEDTVKLARAKIGDGERLTADSAEPKSCADYTRWGLKCVPAIKGPGSVNAGMKWLQSLSAIVIDPVRCPDTAKEFLEYEYDADREGEPIDGYPDHDNHHIDAVRYATEHIWRKPGA